VDGNDQIDQIELVRWLLGPKEANTKVDFEFIDDEEDFSDMVGAAGMGGTEGPEDVTNGDEDGNSIVDQTMAAALAISETGSRLN
jgi:hypothetical protein